VIGLPSLQAMDRAQGARIWMASEVTDMRCGFDRWRNVCERSLERNPKAASVCVPFRVGEIVKILVWDRDGSYFCISAWRSGFSKYRE